MDELEEKIMKYAAKINDWFTPRQAFNAIFPDKTFSSTKWETYKFNDRHKSLTKYGFLERETFHPEGTRYTRYHYRIKRERMEICPNCKERMNARIFENGKETGRYCANCDREYYSKDDEE